MGIDSPEYLESCKDVIKDLDDRGIKASIFFQPFTVPNKEFSEEFIEDGYSVGLHAVYVKDYKDFLGDLNKIPNSFGDKVHGFTKQESRKLDLVRWET